MTVAFTKKTTTTMTGYYGYRRHIIFAFGYKNKLVWIVCLFVFTLVVILLHSIWLCVHFPILFLGTVGLAVSFVAWGGALLILSVWLSQTDVQEDTVYCTWGWCQTECQSSLPQVQPGGKRHDSVVSFVPPSSFLRMKNKIIARCCMWLETC